jgi:hypothetical protein
MGEVYRATDTKLGRTSRFGKRVRSTSTVRPVLLQIQERGGDQSGDRVIPGKNYAATPKMVWMN